MISSSERFGSFFSFQEKVKPTDYGVNDLFYRIDLLFYTRNYITRNMVNGALGQILTLEKLSSWQSASKGIKAEY